jgi:hypothetical protein
MTRFLETVAFYDDPPISPPPPAVPPPPPPPTPGKTYTQAELDKMFADHRKGLQDQNKQMADELQKLRESNSLTQAEKDALDGQIANLKNQYQSKEQAAAAEAEKLRKQLASETEKLSAEGKKWHGEFNNLLIENAIVTGASKHNAASSEQMLDLLRFKAKVVEDVDGDGKPTGKFVAKIPVLVLNPKTNTWETIEYPIVEGIAKMRENPANANLFLTDGKPGFGGNPAAGGGGGKPLDWKNMTPEQHREARKKVGLDRS